MTGIKAQYYIKKKTGLFTACYVPIIAILNTIRGGFAGYVLIRAENSLQEAMGKYLRWPWIQLRRSRFITFIPAHTSFLSAVSGVIFPVLFVRITVFHLVILKLFI